MPDTPRSLTTPAQRAAATEENLAAFFHDMRVLVGYESTRIHGLPVHHAWPTNPMFKGAMQFGPPTGNAQDAVREVVAWFDDRGAPYQFWWFNDASRNPAIDEALLASGFTLDFDADPAMVADLHALATQAPSGDVAIEVAEDAEALGAWRDAFVESYGLPAFAGQAWVDATLALGASAPWRLYVARVDGQPVGTSLMYCGAGVAGLFAVGTTPAARGRGVGRLITQAPLLDARAEGYKAAVLFASPMGKSIYERMGFVDTGRRLGRYLRFAGGTP